MELFAVGQYSLKRAYQKIEEHRQDNVQKEIEIRAKIMKISTERNNSLYQLKKRAIFQDLDNEVYKLNEIICQLLNENVSDNEQSRRFLEQMKQRNRLNDGNIQNQKRKLLLDSIFKEHSEFQSISGELKKSLHKISSDDNYKDIFVRFSNEQLKLINQMISLLEKCQNGSTEADYSHVNELVAKIKELSLYVSIEIEQKAALIKKEADAAEVSVAALNISGTTSNPQVTDISPIIVNSYISNEDKFEQIYSSAIDYLNTVKNESSEISNLKSLENYKFNLKKAVNIPLNSLSTISGQHLNEKYIRFRNLLSGQRIEIAGKSFSAKDHTYGIIYCKDLLAKMFVTQGDFVVSKNPESAFGYASVMIALWIDFPDFGKYILAHFYKQCPYLVPYVPKKLKTESDVDYFIKLGYKQLENGKVENQDKFLQRMSGIVKLFVTMALIKQKPSQKKSRHPFNLNMIWSWLANYLNIAPTSADLSSTILYDFLEVAGHQLTLTYKKQFIKLINYIRIEYMPRLKKISDGGPVRRLEQLLSQNTLEPPKGQLIDNFW